MRVNLVILAGLMVLFVVGAALMLSLMPADPRRAAADGAPDLAALRPALRLGIEPERDVFEQRRRYRALADYLEGAIDRPVTVVTSASYAGVLDDLEHGRVDGAFLGSLTACVAMERLGARVLVNPEHESGKSTYRGVLFVRADSPRRQCEDLAGATIAVVPMTTAGELFATYALADRGLLDAAAPPVLRYEGTHDAVIDAVREGRADAGAAKDIRLDAVEASSPAASFRRLAVGPEVPSNALLAAADLDDETAAALTAALLAMDGRADGRAVLAAFGAVRFRAVDPAGYAAIDEMLREVPELRALLDPGPAPEPDAAAAGE